MSDITALIQVAPTMAFGVILIFFVIKWNGLQQETNRASREALDLHHKEWREFLANENKLTREAIRDITGDYKEGMERIAEEVKELGRVLIAHDSYVRGSITPPGNNQEAIKPE